MAPDAVFSFVHNGSDSALCRHFGMPTGWQGGIAHLKQARIRRAGVGQVVCLTPQGAPVTRYFLAGASFGLSGSIAMRLGRARIARFLGASFARAWHGLGALAAWRACRVRLHAAGFDEIAGIASVTLTVARREGLFDVGVAPGKPRRALWHDLKQGAKPSIRLRTAQLTAAPTVDTPGAVLVETDGEIAGQLPATFDLQSGAINLRI